MSKKQNLSRKELLEKGKALSGEGAKKGKKFLDDFKAFALKGNVLDLAVAVIIGGVFQTIINSVVNDLIMPIIGLIFKFDFSDLYIPLRDGNVLISEAVMSGSDIITPAVYKSCSDLTYAELAQYEVPAFKYGNFITAVINFFIMAFVIFLLVKAIGKLSNIRKKPAAPAAPTTRTCPYCMSEISIKASRCPHCTSEVEPEEKRTENK